ncbi:unnamed protein product [Linum trigynum]|uniref:F-box domain-containing protein n=1 Tax=Linum trigynum TaxID=586398 RepID=A0AAV2EU50_9ROSI
MMMLDEEQRKRRKNNLGMVTSVADQFAKLPDELAVKILSRSATTLNEAARCSSLLGKLWRYMWQLIDCAVLDFEKLDGDVTPEAQRRFVNQVDQAISLLEQSKTRLDGLRIGFKLLNMEEAGWRWIRFGLTARVKRLTLLSYFSRIWCPHGRNEIPVPLFTPEFLHTQDLSRLEVLEFQGVSEIPRGTLDHLFSHCPSLQHLSLDNCTFHDKDTVLRVCCPNNRKFQRLTFNFPEFDHNISRIEVLSAPGLHSLEVRGAEYIPWFEFGDDIAQLQELRFCNQGLCGLLQDCYFPWSRSQFNKFAPRLQLFKYDLVTYNFDPASNRCPDWLQFEKLTVLDLTIYIYHTRGSSMLEVTALLRAAPLLRQLSISFLHAFGYTIWKDRAEESAAAATWKHHSLQLLQLHGVHPSNKKQFLDPRKPQMQLAAYIILNSPSLNQVLVDTRNLGSTTPREPHEVDALVSGARMELESRLHSHTATSQICFTYR